VGPSEDLSQGQGKGVEESVENDDADDDSGEANGDDDNGEEYDGNPAVGYILISKNGLL
jgi:hypothetical protein